MNVDLTRQIVHENKVFAWVDGLGFSGFVASPLQPKVLKPYLDWGGGKIQMDEWQRVLAFFKAYPDNEVQVRLYHNPITGEWKAWAFPQEYPSGMTTKELPEHPHTAEDMVQFGDPWIRLGSVHHHCSMGAFQSGTDTADEATVPGLHITMGKLRDPKWELHSRVSIRLPGKLDAEGKVLHGPIQSFYDAVLPQWFDLPSTYKAILPTKVQATVIEMLLVTPPEATVAFPDRWKDNLVRRVSANPNGAHHHGRGADHQRGTYPNPNRDGHLPRNNILAWEAITVNKLEMIMDMIEVYNDGNGKFACQCVETYKWRDCGFHSLIACESLLRSCGLIQLSNFVWCFPQDKDAVDACQIEAVQREVNAEIANDQLAAEQAYRAGEGY